MHGLGLADDPFADGVLHAQQLVALALQHPVHGHTGPARDHLRDVVGRDGFLHHAAAFGFLRHFQLLFQFRDQAIGQFTRTLELAVALSAAQFATGIVELFLEVSRLAKLVFLGLPARREGGGLLFEITKFLLEFDKPVLRGGIRLLFQGFRLDLETDHLAVDTVEFLRFGIDLHAQPRRRLVHEVDGLVRQEAVRDVAV